MPAERKTNVPERRAAPRYRINQPAVITSQTAGSGAGRIMDFSEFGFLLSVPFPLDVRERVEVRMDDRRIAAVVRSCRCKSGFEFFVGLEIEKDEDNVREAAENARVLHGIREMDASGEAGASTSDAVNETTGSA